MQTKSAIGGLPLFMAMFALVLCGACLAAVADDRQARHECAQSRDADAASLRIDSIVDEQEVSVIRPPVVLCLPELAAAVDAFVERYLDENVRFGDDLSATEREEFLEMANEARTTGYAWSHDIAVEQNFGNGEVVSLLASIWRYTGGAHGNLYFEPLVFDVAEGRLLALEDLFEPGTGWLTPIATFVREDLYRQKRERGTFHISDEEDPFIEEGAEAVLQNFQAYGIYGDAGGDAKGLGFHFAPYAVGAFAEGDFHVTVPAVVFDSYLRDERRTLFR